MSGILSPKRSKGILDPSAVPHYSPLSGMPDLEVEAPPGILSAPNMAGAPLDPAPIGALSLQQPLQAPDAQIERKSYNPFSKDNRQASLLAIGTGLLSHPESFAAGIGAAGQGVGALRDRYNRDNGPQKPTVGGPDDAFEIVTDPVTGKQTRTAIPEFQSYLDKKNGAKNAPSAKDNVAMRASTANAIMKLPKEQREVAYQVLRMDAERLGYDLGLPEQYNENALGAYVGQGITPQADMSNDRMTGNAANAQANKDREYGLRVKGEDRRERIFKRGPAPRKADPNADLNY